MCKQFEKLLAFHCSPALFGIKPSNLVNISLKDFPNINEELEHLNRKFNPRIYFKLLNKTISRALILVYQASKLSKTIFDSDNYDFLLNYNYPNEKNLEVYLDKLQTKLSNNEDFPHEIGVFLGYDLDDIKEYQSGNKNCLYVGYWKVFSKKEEKMKIFDQYTKCKNAVFRLLDKGYRLEAII